MQLFALLLILCMNIIGALPHRVLTPLIKLRSYFSPTTIPAFIASKNGALASTAMRMSSNHAGGKLCADVIPVPTLSDNYAYIMVDRGTGKAACVDPAEPEKTLAAAAENSVELSALLCTHKHWDHSGGNTGMKKALPALDVVGSASEEDVPAMTIALQDQGTYNLGGLTVRALHTPCHTRGHVMFYVTGPEGAPLLFSGDTLFIGGCGRFFEGSAEEMRHALMDVAASLPLDTGVFWSFYQPDLPANQVVGHEYTVSNLMFALSVEPSNQALQDKMKWAHETLAAGGVTIPSTIGEELQYNPFMRVDQPGVKAVTKAEEPSEVMAKLREMKNNYRPPPTTAGRGMPSL